MPVGTVKWYDCRKGFGFIVHEDGTDVFVHYTVIEGDGFRRLFDGEQVEYDIGQGPKGLLAKRVRRLSPDPRRGSARAQDAKKRNVTGGGVSGGGATPAGGGAAPPGGGTTPPEEPES